MQRQETKPNTSSDTILPFLAEFEPGETVPTPTYSANALLPSAPPIDEPHTNPPIDSSIDLIREEALAKIHEQEQETLLEHFKNYLRGDDNLAVFRGVRTTGGTPDFTEPLGQLNSKYQAKLKAAIKKRISEMGVFSPRTLIKDAATPTSLIGTAFLFASPVIKIPLALAGILYGVHSQYSHQQIVKERANILLAKLPLDIGEPEQQVARSNESWTTHFSLFSLFSSQRNTADSTAVSENRPNRISY